MASASISNSVSNDERRWVVVGVCLTKVLTPALRNVLGTEITKWHQVLCQPPAEIDKQVFGPHKRQLTPSTLDLNYKNINNNNVHKSPRAYNYQVKDPLSLAKLFVQPFMSKFTGFDETMDLSAVLSVICEAAPFTAAAAHAKTVRSDVRNEWAHCNFPSWTKVKFLTCIQSMETLLRNVNLSFEDEQRICDELSRWKNEGLQFCFGHPVNIEVLTSLRDKVDDLCASINTWVLKKEQMTSLISHLGNIHSNLDQEITNLRMRVEKCEKMGADNCKEIKLLEKKFTSELSRYFVKEDEKIPYVFSAPPRNCYFAGRKVEIQELKSILKVEETLNKKKVGVAAVWGLGGVGKTSLVSEYAHQMQDFYKGGVYWFSAEDDSFLEKTVNDVALKIGALLGSFDLTLSNILRKIGSADDPSLIVLDCLDQQTLSHNMMKFLSFSSQENIFGHFVVLTRRNPSLLVNEISILEEDSCLQLKCFLSQEAKQFLFSRTSVTCDEAVESVAESLCEELGRLPLALEQAGACIKILGCSLSSYLEQYKSERLKLLSQQKARPASPGNESRERQAVHTTWCMNIEHMRKSPNGPAAVTFMNACSFFNANQIEEELINVGTPDVKDTAFRQCVSSPLGGRQILKLFTDFSLFSLVDANSVSTHRLVQEIVREALDDESKAESFVDAVRMLSYAFIKCPSPSRFVGSSIEGMEEQEISAANLPKNPSLFYLWSKYCSHGHYLRRHIEKMLDIVDSGYLEPVWCSSTAKVLYECAVHLSANHKQEEAKGLLNFAYRILDWLPVAEYEMIKMAILDNSLFPLAIPLLRSFQIVVRQFCMPPLVSVPSLPQKSSPDASGFGLSELNKRIEKLRFDGNVNFKGGRYKEALHAYSFAINLAIDCGKTFNPLLITNRSMAYLKLKQYEDALKDANDYITRRPDCWKGYARKALALDGLNEKVSAEIAASLAFYHNRCIFSEFQPFKESLFDMKERILICDTAHELRDALLLSYLVEWTSLKILVLGSQDYILNSNMVGRPAIVTSNCILVGTTRNRSATLKLEGDLGICLLGKCMVTNVSFCCNEGEIICLRGSFVKFLNCYFSNTNDSKAVVLTEGELNVEQCEFANSKSIGLLCAGAGDVVVVDCLFCNNGLAGVQVHQGGMLMMKNSRMSHNAVDGLMIGPNAAKCVVVNCDIQHNDRDGIFITHTKNITLIHNNIFGNRMNGISMSNSEADIRGNNFFDNGWWGICSESNSWCNISMNKIFRNKSGGIRVGHRAAGRNFPPSVVEMNKIHDNIGPGFVDNLNMFEVGSSKHANIDLKKSYLKSPNSLQRAECKDNEMHSNKEGGTVGRLKFSFPYCSNCRAKGKLDSCRNCFTAAYCNKTCKENHWSKHEKLCNVLREKTTFLITSMKSVRDDSVIKRLAKILEKIDPKPSPPPPRDGNIFVVKVKTVVKNWSTEPFGLLLYDRSLELYEAFQSKLIHQIVREFGIQSELQLMEKQLFLYCLFEKNGQLRLFINDFSDFLKW